MDIDDTTHGTTHDTTHGTTHDRHGDGMVEDAQRLLQALGARLRTRSQLDASRRSALVDTLVDATRDDRSSRGSSRVSSRATGTSAPGADGRPPRFGRAGRDADGQVRGRLRDRWVGVTAGIATLALVAGASLGVLRSGDDLPIILASGGAPGGAAGAPFAADAMDTSLRAESGLDRMWWTPTIHRFVLADGVTFPAGSAPAWRLVPPADLAAAAARLTAILGLPDARAAEWDAASLQSEGADGSSLWVGASGDWYYSAAFDESLQWICDEAPVADRDGAAGSAPDSTAVEPAPVDCTPPAPPIGVPSEARARTLALEVLARVGHGDARITSVHVDEWGAWVSAEPTLAGLPAGVAGDSGLMVSVGFGGGERLTSASGTFATVERLGAYPTIDVAAALVRLEKELSAWLTDGPVARPFPADMGAPAVEPAPEDGDTPVSDGDAPVTSLPAPDGPGGGDGAKDPEPDLGPAPDPVEVTVTIVTVELVTSLAWSADGTVLLIPHYRLVDSDGGWWFVIAVEDRYVTR
jgi:hypothetical protein